MGELKGKASLEAKIHSLHRHKFVPYTASDLATMQNKVQNKDLNCNPKNNPTVIYKSFKSLVFRNYHCMPS